VNGVVFLSLMCAFFFFFFLRVKNICFVPLEVSNYHLSFKKKKNDIRTSDIYFIKYVSAD
jgi:hypothetical protein